MKRCRAVLLLCAAVVPAGALLAQDPTSAEARLAVAESAFAAVRDIRDQIDILQYRGPALSLDDSVARLTPVYRAARDRLVRLLDLEPQSFPDSLDRRAVVTMRNSLRRDLGPAIAKSADTTESQPADCRYDPRQLLLVSGAMALSNRLYGCFGYAARNLEVGAERVTRLTLLSRLAAEPDSVKRRELFMSLKPVWAAVDGGAVSPWRILFQSRAAGWPRGSAPYQRAARETGIPADTIVAWLESALEQWRRATPDRRLEPWDLYYEMGEAGRLLAPRVPRDSLLAINNRYYRDLGADPDALGIEYDILPRPGKGPVAFTSIGRRAGNGRKPQEWVFATYAEGGFGNLEELLHETGHGIHLAGLRTRPAFADWPASDIFTEAIADVAALEVYEPAWQFKYLGDSVPLAPSIREKYFSIMMDIAWALFEIRLEREPSLNPNRVWTAITSRYFHVVPHPELAWWAMRGQLIDETGYMLNYALGAILIADVRAALRQQTGGFTTGDLDFYPLMRERIYRFGRERSARRVVADFLGREPRSAALLADLARIQAK